MTLTFDTQINSAHPWLMGGCVWSFIKTGVKRKNKPFQILSYCNLDLRASEIKIYRAHPWLMGESLCDDGCKYRLRLSNLRYTETGNSCAKIWDHTQNLKDACSAIPRYIWNKSCQKTTKFPESLREATKFKQQHLVNVIQSSRLRSSG